MNGPLDRTARGSDDRYTRRIGSRWLLACTLIFTLSGLITACSETTETGSPSGQDAGTSDTTQADGSTTSDVPTPGDDTTSQDTSTDTDPGDVDPGDTDPGDIDPGDTDPGDTDPGDTGPDVDPADVPSDVPGDDVADSDQPDTAAPDADADGDSDTTAPPEPEWEVTRMGTRLYGTTVALSRTDRTLWIGTRGNGVPPDFTTVSGGLTHLDLDTGAVGTLEAELPEIGYETGAGAVQGPIPVAEVQQDLDRRVAVVINGLIVLENDEVTHKPLTWEGQPVVPINLGITRDALHHWAWLSSSAGLLFLQPNTLEIQAVYPPSAFGGDGSLGKLAIEPSTGAVYVAFYPESGPSTIHRVDTQGNITTFTPGDQDTPTGFVGDLAWSEADQRLYAAIGSWDPYAGGVLSWDGTTATTVATEGQLSVASIGEAAAFGAQVLALDDDGSRLFVGGRIQGNPLGPSKGGGLAVIDLDTPNHFAGIPQSATPFVGMHVTDIEYDPVTDRAYIAILGQCSEVKLRNYGLYALSPDPAANDGKGALRLERPILSGVRALLDLDEGFTVGLRDDYPGLACEGYPVSTGLARVQSNQAARTIELGVDGISPLPGITAADGDSLAKLAIATWKDGVFFGGPGTGTATNPALAFKMSLLVDDVVWVDENTAWAAGRTSHGPGDAPGLADVGPHGAARFTVDSKGGILSHEHFVANSNLDTDIKGLPSNDVRAVLPLGDGRAYLACATERVSGAPFDRVEQDVFLLGGTPRLGGVALVGSDNSITIVATSADAPDARALALLPNGDLLVADAQNGLLRVTGDSVLPFETDLPLPDTWLPVSLWVGEDGDMAVGTDRGVAVKLGGQLGFIEGTGFVWDMLYKDDILWLGTDEGLVQVRLPETASPTLPAPETPGALPFIEVLPPKPDTGDCLGAGEPCVGADLPCCAPLACGGGFVPQCE